jgi:hypothetical protein
MVWVAQPSERGRAARTIVLHQESATPMMIRKTTAHRIVLTSTVLMGVSALLAAVVEVRGASDDPAKPIDIGDRNQVFIDGRYLAAARDVRIVVCPPRKTYERCLIGLHPYDTILPVDGTFRGFHALSKDGVHWRRVEPGTPAESDDLLGLYEGQPHPFVDPQAPADQRYKLFDAESIKASADGSQWRTIATQMFPPQASTRHIRLLRSVCRTLPHSAKRGTTARTGTSCARSAGPSPTTFPTFPCRRSFSNSTRKTRTLEA